MNKNLWKSAIGGGFALSCCLLTHPTSALAEFDDLIPAVTSREALTGNGPLNFQKGKGGGGGGGAKSGGGGGGGAKSGGGGGGGAKSGGGGAGGAKSGGGGAGGAKSGGGGTGGAKSGGGGAGGPKSGGGGEAKSGGGGGARPSDGGGGGRSGGGGIHAPSVSGPRGNAGRSGHPPVANRTPSFTRPGSIGQPTRPPGHAGGQIGNPIRHPGLPENNRPGAGAAHIGRSGPVNGTQRPSASNRIGAEINNLDRNLNRGTSPLNNSIRGVPRLGGGHSIIGNQPFTGNNLRLGNRNFNIGSNQYRPSYYRHSGYHGYWNGNRGSSFGSALAYGLGSSLGTGYGGYGNGGYGNGWGWGMGRSYGRYRSYGGYGYRPLGWGMGGWGLGSLNYNSGYLGYSNPYYANNSSAVYNYSLPVPVSYASTTAVPDNGVSSSAQVLDDAVLAFQQNDYDQSLDITNKGIAQYPDDAVLHEFRSLVLFAKQDYQQSAATIHSVLAVGPGWDWTTLSGIYADVSLYTVQLRSLEAFTKSNPQDAASQFLLAYHYMSCGHPDAAAQHFQQVVTLMPSDQVASDLATMLTPPEPASTTSGVPQAAAPGPGDEPAGPAATPIDPKSLIGVWKASRDDGSQFGLTITEDAKFTWSFTPKGQAAQGFGGTYTVEENVLALESQDGGSLIAEITPGDTGNFNFRMLGAPEADTGLNFSK